MLDSGYIAHIKEMPMVAMLEVLTAKVTDAESAAMSVNQPVWLRCFLSPRLPIRMPE
jgi:hypothetical protein